MPNYNIYYFVIKPLQINIATGSSGVRLSSPGQSSPVVQRIFAGFRTELTTLMNSAKQHIPYAPSRAQTINVVEIPSVSGNPTSPDFSGLTIQMYEPIVYFTNRDLNERPSAQVDRRPEYIMLSAIQNARSQEFPDDWVRSSRSVLASTRESGGLAMPGLPGVSFPVTACVFSNSTQNWEASNWQVLLSYNLASAAFHEIAHCKSETRSRSNNPRWRKAINDPSRPAGSIYNSIHDIPNVGVLSSNGIGQDATPTDFTVMGEHMLCPINFYRLDRSINNQCFRNGSTAALTPR